MGTLPPEVARRLEERHGVVRVVDRVGGGCINPSVRLRLGGADAFLKYNLRAPPDMFAAEAVALRALRRAAEAVRVPAVLEVWEAGSGAGYLLLEWLEPCLPGPGFGERLGRGLAALHRAGRGGWGWESDGYIGSLPQRNTPLPSWAEFWWERRLAPQLRAATEAGWRIGVESQWTALQERLPGLLAPAEAEDAALLHGDLWSGNLLATRGAGGVEPALVDPASYRGHREVDLAMAELFGGFPAEFLAAYREAWPLAPGYAPGRRAVYQLYYLLVHVNHFGAGYVSASECALEQALAAASRADSPA